VALCLCDAHRGLRAPRRLLPPSRAAQALVPRAPCLRQTRASARGCYLPRAGTELRRLSRHKTTLLAPSIFKAANIPIHEVLQTEGSFVLVLSSTFHFGFNHGPNIAEAVNFGLAPTWLPACTTARPCTCDGNQTTPHIDVPLLLRRVRAAYPEATQSWWTFHCACGELVTNFDAEEAMPTGEQFECVGCANWGHLECYPEYAAAAARGEALSTLELYCVSCRDAWRDTSHGGESWTFTCVCGRNEGASDTTVTSGDAPSGRMFQCSKCEAWSHTECYDEFRGLDDDELPDIMQCHRCSKRRPPAKRSSKAASRSPPSPKPSKTATKRPPLSPPPTSKASRTCKRARVKG